MAESEVANGKDEVEEDEAEADGFNEVDEMVEALIDIVDVLIQYSFIRERRIKRSWRNFQSLSAFEEMT